MIGRMDGSDRSMDRNETRYTRQARRELANAQVCLTNAGLYFHLREGEVWPQALGVGIVNHLISGTRLTACQPVWQRIELGGGGGTWPGHHRAHSRLYAEQNYQ